MIQACNARSTTSHRVVSLGSAFLRFSVRDMLVLRAVSSISTLLYHKLVLD